MEPARRPGRAAESEDSARIRRIETRLTQTMIALNIPTSAQKPQFDAGALGQPARIQLPSPHSSMKEILDNIPETWEGSVGVFVGNDLVATIRRPGN